MIESDLCGVTFLNNDYSRNILSHQIIVNWKGYRGSATWSLKKGLLCATHDISHYLIKDMFS